jgi:TPR repeat protein
MKRALMAGFALGMTVVPVFGQPGASTSEPQNCHWQQAPDPAAKAQLRCRTSAGEWRGVIVPRDFDQHTFEKAEADDPRAMALVGAFYGVLAPRELRDGRLAIRWLRKAAQEGRTDAMVTMAEILDEGILVPPNPVDAARWYEKAANGGNVAAMFMIAIRYDRGKGGVQEDASKAAFWFRKCADLGDGGCMGGLSGLYAKGRGVPKDVAESKRLWKRYGAEIEKRSRSVHSEVGGNDPAH